jgi:hypothetical protein
MSYVMTDQTAQKRMLENLYQRKAEIEVGKDEIEAAIERLEAELTEPLHDYSKAPQAEPDF